MEIAASRQRPNLQAPGAPRSRGRSGLTLIELLTTMAVIAILASVTIPSFRTAKETALRASCLSNLRQLIDGAVMYSADQPDGALSGATSDGDDNQNWLFPYAGSLRVFSCPSARHRVRPGTNLKGRGRSEDYFLDLENNASRKGGYGSSYEVFGFMGFNSGATTRVPLRGVRVPMPGVKKTATSVLTYAHASNAFGLRGAQAGPANIWLLLDGDDLNDPNTPAKDGNHGDAGANVSFCDGHVEFVRAADFAYRYELSQDEGRER